MKITVLRKMMYERSYIYIMQFEYVFQYLVPHGNDIYQDRLEVLPGLLKRILWRLGIVKTPYTKRQVEEYETIVMSGAMDRIDAIKDPKYEKERRRKIRLLQSAREKARRKGCVWQTRTFKKESYYYCITHKEVVRMRDGVVPKHK